MSYDRILLPRIIGLYFCSDRSLALTVQVRGTLYKSATQPKASPGSMSFVIRPWIDTSIVLYIAHKYLYIA